MAERVIAIIPARGGSKGIPRKNLRPLLGRPLIAYAIEAAQLSEYVDRVIVSTDDLEIANVSASFGAETIERPAAISGDLSSSESALLHALDHLDTVESYRPDLLVFLQCTSPLTKPEDIDATIDRLRAEDADSALAVVPVHCFLWHVNAQGEAVGINHDKRERLLRQQRDPEYVETGAIYVLRVKEFLKARHRFFGKTVLSILPEERNLDIDTILDFERAASVIRARQEERA